MTFQQLNTSVAFLCRPVLLVLCLVALSGDVAGQKQGQVSHDKHRHKSEQPAQPKAKQTEPTNKFVIPDVEVLDQSGQRRKFYSELVKDKVVIVNFIFTTCTAVCPRSGANFRKLQTLLGERLGKDVFLVSVSTDPETDTPPKLKSWSAKFHAKEGWTLVTGEEKSITPLLRVLTGDGPNKGYHEPAICIINDKKGTRRWVYGLEEPERLIKLTDELETFASR